MGSLIQNAVEHSRRRKRSEPLVVAGIDPPTPAPPEFESRRAGPVEFRSATSIGVSYAKRMIELVVMPYEQRTRVPHSGRMIDEVVSRGAFSSVPRDGGRVRCNLHHDRTKTVGRAIRIDPDRHEGLVAELRISRTALGDETLALAEDRVLDASAGSGSSTSRARKCGKPAAAGGSTTSGSTTSR